MVSRPLGKLETSVHFTFQQQLERLDRMLEEHLSEQHARMHEVEMDAYDFSPRSPDAEASVEESASAPAAKTPAEAEASAPA